MAPAPNMANIPKSGNCGATDDDKRRKDLNACLVAQDRDTTEKYCESMFLIFHFMLTKVQNFVQETLFCLK
ncbi:hypothetical protein ACTXT7_000114 [Hymenolepis weldensis]